MKIEGYPENLNHLGSFVYIASLITAIGRTILTNYIN